LSGCERSAATMLTGKCRTDSAGWRGSVTVTPRASQAASHSARSATSSSSLPMRAAGPSRHSSRPRGLAATIAASTAGSPVSSATTCEGTKGIVSAFFSTRSA